MGEKCKRFYIPQAWLSAEWKRLNGSPVVYVKKYDKGGKSVRGLSRYLVAQYFADQANGGKCSIAYHSYSRRIFGFPFVLVFREFGKLCKQGGLTRGQRFERWNAVLRGQIVEVGGDLEVSLDSIREGWALCRKEKKPAGIARSKRAKLDYGKVSNKLQEAYDFVAAGHTWRDAVPAKGVQNVEGDVRCVSVRGIETGVAVGGVRGCEACGEAGALGQGADLPS